MNIGILFLLASSVCDAVWNVCLKQSKGITDWLVNIIGACFLMVGIFTFKRALEHFPLSIATVIWFGVSLVLTTVLDVFLFKTMLNYKIVFFMMLCVISVVGLNHFSPAK